MLSSIRLKILRRTHSKKDKRKHETIAADWQLMPGDRVGLLPFLPLQDIADRAIRFEISHYILAPADLVSELWTEQESLATITNR